MEEVRIGNLVHQAESHQRDGMRVYDSVEIGAGAVDLLVEGQFGRGTVWSLHGAIGAHADDVVAAQAAFVEARGRDPYVAVVFAYGEVAARSRGHAVAVDALNGL